LGHKGRCSRGRKRGLRDVTEFKGGSLSGGPGGQIDLAFIGGCHQARGKGGPLGLGEKGSGIKGGDVKKPNGRKGVNQLRAANYSTIPRDGGYRGREKIRGMGRPNTDLAGNLKMMGANTFIVAFSGRSRLNMGQCVKSSKEFRGGKVRGKKRGHREMSMSREREGDREVGLKGLGVKGQGGVARRGRH